MDMQREKVKSTNINLKFVKVSTSQVTKWLIAFIMNEDSMYLEIFEL